MIAIVNATLMTATQGTIENGTLVLDGDGIVAIGAGLEAPAGAEIVDGTGKVVTPGLIDAHSHVGIFCDGVNSMESDGNEVTDPVTPHLRAIDAIHLDNMAFDDLRAGGVTTVNTGPGSANLVGGQFACIKTKPTTRIDDVILMAPSGMKMALGENPKRAYGGQKKMPSTRMGNAAKLRCVLVEAQNYRDRLQRCEEKVRRYEQQLAEWEDETERGERPQPPDPVDRDLRLEALIPVLEGKLRAMIHCHRSDDILTAIRIAEEFGLRFSIEHATEGHLIADMLAEKEIPCVVGPVLMGRPKYELRELTPANPGIMSRAGVKIAIQTDTTSATRYLRMNAGLAVQHGMDEDEAFKAITINAAEIIGVADRIGSLDVGKDADIAIFTAHPFDYRSRCERVYIDGEVVYRDL